MIKFGITEAGDAGLDLSWAEKMHSVNGAILITKNPTDEFLVQANSFFRKVIVHITCTGYGGTVVEPNVPSVDVVMGQLKKLICADFPIEQIVVRIDPIIPTPQGFTRAVEVVRKAVSLGVQRFRISVLDTYPHVRNRFKEAGLPLPYGENFMASDEQFAAVDTFVIQCLKMYDGIRIECCAEPKLTQPIQTGCISDYDLKLLGLEVDAEAYPKGLQRRGCLCPSFKTELLSNKAQCPHGCLYCYWRS